MVSSSMTINSAEIKTTYHVTKSNELMQQTGGWFARFRRSNQLVVIVNFFSMVTGIMVVSVLQPILPELLDVIWRASHTANSSTYASTTEDSGIAALHDHDTSRTDSISAINGVNTSVVSNATFPQKSFIIGSLLGFAPLIEIFFTPLAVLSIKYFGFKKPMIAACLLQIFGCYAIAYANILALLYTARITQAISVIFATVAGFSLIAIRFSNDDERSHALTTSMHGFAVGILIAYPCGTALYSYFGVTMPFIVISVLSVIGTILVLLVKETENDRKCQYSDSVSSSYWKLLTNPAILLSLTLIAYSWCVVFILGATTPNRMSTLYKARCWEIGLVLFVSTLTQIVTSGIVGKLAAKLNRWAVTMFGNLITCAGLVAYPICPKIFYAIAPETCVRIGWGVVTASMGPLLGTLVDQSHGMAYIRVYALFTSFNLFGAFAGSMVGGWLDGIIGFDLLYWGCSGVTLVVAIAGYCLSFCLPDEEIVNETCSFDDSECRPLLHSSSGRYNTSHFNSSSFSRSINMA